MDGKLEIRLFILERNKVPEWISVEYRNLFSIFFAYSVIFKNFFQLSFIFMVCYKPVKGAVLHVHFSSFKIRIVPSKLSDPSLMSWKTLATCLFFHKLVMVRENQEERQCLVVISVLQKYWRASSGGGLDHRPLPALYSSLLHIVSRPLTHRSLGNLQLRL